MMRISVVIPAFNAADVIGETLDSVQRQTLPPHEVIVVDDGSLDGTASVARAHPLKPIVLAQPNKGAASALNAGVRAAAGDAIAFLDADDLWSPEKLEVQAAALAEDGADHAVFGHSECFVCPSISPERRGDLHYVQGPTPAYLIGAMLVSHAWLAPTGFDETLRTGYFIEWFRVSRDRGLKIRMLNRLVHHRRVRPGTLGSRRVRGGDDFSTSILEIARRSILAKRGALAGDP
jgi:glycosyltransferase involved in cell wall biosynthesis